MQLTTIWLTDFRSYESLELPLETGLTAIVGPNGRGKTNVLEAIGMLSTLKSFRGAPTESLVRRGAQSAFVRAEGLRDDREVLIELELTKGRTRAQVNRQRLKRSSDLLGALRTTVFAPDDLALVKQGPSVRREYLDDVLVALDPKNDALLREVDKVVRQRNALLRQSHGRLDEAGLSTLDVWDQKLGSAGAQLTSLRENLVQTVLPLLHDAYALLAGAPSDISASYERSWQTETLADALAEQRDNDVRRGVTTVGPHRDELALRLNGLLTRTEASQGEQRTLALALRLAGHQLTTNVLGEPPLLLLDDVLSELDPDRATALLNNLPPGQVVITSASDLPPAAKPDRVLNFSTSDEDATLIDLTTSSEIEHDRADPAAATENGGQ